MRKSIGMLIVVAMLVLAAGTTFAQTGEQCTVTGSNVNLRAGPGTQYGVAGALNGSLPVTGQNSDGTWYQVDHPDQAAWVAAHVVTTSGDCSAVPVASVGGSTQTAAGTQSDALEVFTCQVGNFRGVRPVGWIFVEEQSGCSAVSQSSPTALLSQVAVDMPAGEALYSIAADLSNTSGSETVNMQLHVVGTQTTQYLSWQHFEIPVTIQPGTTISYDVAVAEAADGDGSYIILFVTRPEDREHLLDTVFEPVLAAFEPLGAEVSTNQPVPASLDISMEEFHCSEGQFTSVRPIGQAWMQEGCGSANRAIRAALQQSAFTTPAEETFQTVVGNLTDSPAGTDVTGLANIVGEPQSAHLDWIHYEIPQALNGVSFYVDLAIAGSEDGGSYTIMLTTFAAENRAALLDAIFYPAIAAFEPAPALNIPLEPLTCTSGDFQSIRPVGWGTMAGPCSSNNPDLHVVLYQVTYDLPADQTLPAILDALPYASADYRWVGTQTSEHLTWEHYALEASVTENGQVLYDIALAEIADGSLTYGIVIWTLDTNREAMLAAIFQPILAAFEPIGEPAARHLNAQESSVQYGPATLSVVSLNQNGTQVTVEPGEAVQITARYRYACSDCQPGSINQIIVGIDGLGAQECIYNGSISGSGSASFSLIAPSEPGTYSVRFRYAQARSCASAVENWWDVDQAPPASAEIATIIVSPAETTTSAATGDANATRTGAPGRNADWTPVIERIDGVEMVQVPAGCFMMGSDAGNGNEIPVHEVCLSTAFWIDRYEVTNALYGSLGCTQSSSDPEQPRNCVTWFDAQAFCESRGGRLPTEAEWEYAARGPDGLEYPWGDAFSDNHVIYQDSAVYGRTQAAPVGSHPTGASWVGAQDMSGNVAEWVADWYSGYSASAQVDPQGPDSGRYHPLRGGSYFQSAFFVRAAFRSIWLAPGFSNYEVGFRCVRPIAGSE